MTAGRWAAIVVAAGRGARFGQSKQLLELAGLPMAGWSIRTFAQMPEVAQLIVVTEPDSVEPMRELVRRLAGERDACVVEGGARRQDSVRNGLAAVAAGCATVLVHDGARPLVRAHDVRTAMAQVRARRAAVLAEPVVDTIKIVDAASHVVTSTPDRRTLWAAQTPQLALTADLRAAHARAHAEGVEATDDAMLLERDGVEVAVVASTGENFKVTLPADAARAEVLLRSRAVAV